MTATGWTAATRDRWFAAMEAAGFERLSRDTMEKGDIYVMAYDTYWRSCMVTYQGRSKSAEIEGGRGWPERLAEMCIEAATKLRAEADPCADQERRARQLARDLGRGGVVDV